MRKVTLITNDDLSGTLFLNYLVKCEIEIKKIYVVSSIRGNLASKVKKSLKLFKRRSPVFIFYRFFVEKILFKLKLVNKSDLLSTVSLGKRYNIAVENVDDVHNAGFISNFDDFRNSEDLVLSAYGSQIFGSDLIDRVKNFWNIHGSYLPYFKGAAPYFWMLFKEGAPKGVTLHHMVLELDSGQIIDQVTVDPDAGQSLLLYHAKCIIEAARMFVSNFSDSGPSKDMITDIAGQKENEESSRKYGLPSSDDVKEFRNCEKVFFRWSDFDKIKKMLNTEQF